VVSSSHESAREVEDNANNILNSFGDLNEVITSLDSQIQLISSAANQQMSVTSNISTNIEQIQGNAENVTNSLSRVTEKATEASDGSSELDRAVSGFSI
jgi:methyl-accepting chemotaxis protein